MFYGPVSGPRRQRKRVCLETELCLDCRHCSSCGAGHTWKGRLERGSALHVGLFSIFLQ